MMGVDKDIQCSIFCYIVSNVIPSFQMVSTCNILLIVVFRGINRKKDLNSMVRSKWDREKNNYRRQDVPEMKILVETTI